MRPEAAWGCLLQQITPDRREGVSAAKETAPQSGGVALTPDHTTAGSVSGVNANAEAPKEALRLHLNTRPQGVCLMQTQRPTNQNRRIGNIIKPPSTASEASVLCAFLTTRGS